MIALVNALEHFFTENAALKVTLEHHHVSQKVYEKECAEAISSVSVHSPIFSKLRDEIQKTTDLSAPLEALLRTLPKSKNVH